MEPLESSASRIHSDHYLALHLTLAPALSSESPALLWACYISWPFHEANRTSCLVGPLSQIWLTYQALNL